ncbi:MAG: 3-dehydroquinate synthase [Chitinophagaceae bacterium]|nr:3-dehydroquinate synthase [Chitinophagaceae bacterium]
MQYSVTFPSRTTDYHPSASLAHLQQLANVANTIIITDNNVWTQYQTELGHYEAIVVEAGEQSKSIETVQDICKQLAELQAHKTTILVGVGGGMITDLTGFVATIYMRGIAFGFVPTTILAMVDAAIGGKNGVNVGLHKNMLGAIQQPNFIAYDYTMLASLPTQEWSSGFAEIIKYACIGDAALFQQLQATQLQTIMENTNHLQAIIAQCVAHKNKIVLADEHENHIRKTLNFGHTAGHAFETLYTLPHGQAVALGMIVAFIASEQHLQLPKKNRQQLVAILQQFQLPTTIHFEIEAVMSTLKMDKKRKGDSIDFILLSQIGEAVIYPLTFPAIAQALQVFAHEHKA